MSKMEEIEKEDIAFIVSQPDEDIKSTDTPSFVKSLSMIVFNFIYAYKILTKFPKTKNKNKTNHHDGGKVGEI